MRIVTALVVLPVVVTLIGCSPSFEDATRAYSIGALSEDSIAEVAASAAASTSRDGRPPIAVESVVLSGSPPSQAATVSVDLEMAADSWDAAFRAAEFGTLLVPSLFSHPDLASVTVVFGAQGDELVDYTFSRADSGRINWAGQLDALELSDGSSWPSFFKATSSSLWRRCQSALLA